MSAGKSQANSPAVSVIIPAYMTADLERQIEPYRHRLLYNRQENRGTGVRAAHLKSKALSPTDLGGGCRVTGIPTAIVREGHIYEELLSRYSYQTYLASFCEGLHNKGAG
jgi:hypothetical protein